MTKCCKVTQKANWRLIGAEVGVGKREELEMKSWHGDRDMPSSLQHHSYIVIYPLFFQMKDVDILISEYI